MPESKLTYTEAFEELQDMVKKMENEDISFDDLTKSIDSANELIKICKEKLSKTEAEVNKIIGQNN